MEDEAMGFGNIKFGMPVRHSDVVSKGNGDPCVQFRGEIQLEIGKTWNHKPVNGM